MVDLLAEVMANCGIEDVPSTHLTEAAKCYEAAVTSQATLIPAAKETVKQVRAQGYKIGLLSNTMFTGAAHMADLDRFGLTEYFDTMLFSADVNKWKPGAAPFLHVLEDLGVEPAAAVYVGDDPGSDVVGGQRAGMHTIHINSSQRFHMPENIKPHAQIQDLVELPSILLAWANGAK